MDSMSSLRVRHPATLALLLVPLTLPAYAQQVPDGATPDPAATVPASADEQVSTLDQVQVVGQAMTYSKTNVSKEMLDRQFVLGSVNDALNELPGVVVTEADAFGSSDWGTQIRAVMPVMTTRLIPPEVPHVSRLRLKTLYALAPVATIGAGLSGLAMGAFWGLLPVYANRIGLDADGVAMFMLTAIVGGAVLQWPIGRISDGHDRRIGLVTVSTLAAAIAIAAALPMVQTQTTVLFVLFFVYGGLAFSLYPFAV